jgi:hypothetical protein
LSVHRIFVVIAVALILSLELSSALLLYLGLLLALNVLIQVALGDQTVQGGRHDLLGVLNVEGRDKLDDPVSI